MITMLGTLHVISEKCKEEHDAQFQRWCNDMLKNTRLTNMPNVEVREYELDKVYAHYLNENVESHLEFGNDVHNLWDIP